MADIQITVAGPGGCIFAEGIIIRRALEAAGIHVDFTDDHPAPMTDDYILAHFSTIKRKSSVHIKMVHCPWGG